MEESYISIKGQKFFPFCYRIELEKTLQQCIKEKDEYKEKYEECNR